MEILRVIGNLLKILYIVYDNRYCVSTWYIKFIIVTYKLLIPMHNRFIVVQSAVP